jgi:SAM-dependent methyltransferase
MDARIKTSTRGFMASRVTVVTRWIMDHVAPGGSDLLDFGAGVGCYQSRHLFDAGHNVWQTDLPDTVAGWGDSDDLWWVDLPAADMTFDYVLLSNVLNVQDSQADLRRTIQCALDYTAPGGLLVANYPTSPRKLGWTRQRLLSFLMVDMGLFVCSIGDIILIRKGN